MKQFEAQTMIEQGRFAVMFRSLSAEQQQAVVEKMSGYILDCPYQDAGNYAHLCNIFSIMAIYQTLLEQGLDKQSALKAAAEAMYSFIEAKRLDILERSSAPGFLAELRQLMPQPESQGQNQGWQVEYAQAQEGEFAFTVRRCIYPLILSRYGMAELGPLFCRVDDIIYGQLPQIAFLRQGTICRGAAVCDFMFRKR